MLVVTSVIPWNIWANLFTGQVQFLFLSPNNSIQVPALNDRIIKIHDSKQHKKTGNCLLTTMTWSAINYFNQPIWLHSRWSVILSISVVAATIFSWVRCSERSVRLCLLVGASVLAFLAATGSTAVRITRSVIRQFSLFHTFSTTNVIERSQLKQALVIYC